METSANCSVGSAQLDTQHSTRRTRRCTRRPSAELGGVLEETKVRGGEVRGQGHPENWWNLGFPDQIASPLVLPCRVLATVRLFSESWGRSLVVHPAAPLCRCLLSRRVLPPPAEFPYLAISDLLSPNSSYLAGAAGRLRASADVGGGRRGSPPRPGLQPHPFQPRALTRLL